MMKKVENLFFFSLLMNARGVEIICQRRKGSEGLRSHHTEEEEEDRIQKTSLSETVRF